MPNLKMILRRLLTVELTIRGKSYEFIIDSGCNLSVINKEILPELSDDQKRNVVAMGFKHHGGNTEEKVFPVRFNLIGVAIDRISIANSSLMHIGEIEAGEGRFGGLIGLDILRRFNSVEFDFGKRIIRFKP